MAYKYVNEDKDSFTIHKMGDDKPFKIAKSKISQELHGKIKSMGPVKMADGGEVPEEDAAPDMSTAPNALNPNPQPDVASALTPNIPTPPPGYNPYAQMYQDKLKSLKDEFSSVPEETLKKKALDDIERAKAQDESKKGQITPIDQLAAQNKEREANILGLPSFMAPTPGEATTMTPEQAQAQSGLEGMPQVPQQQQGPSSSALNPSYEKILNEEEKGMKGMARAQMTAAKATADAEIAFQEQTKVHAQSMAKIAAERDSSDALLAKDYADSKIDPNAVWHNMDTGSKIGAALSIVLSGIGTGLTGQPNMAMQVINDAISRDVEAQKSNINKKGTLLNQNLIKYKNIQDAEMATYASQIAITQAKLRQIGAVQTGSQAAAQLHVLNSNLEQQRMALNTSVAKRQAELQSMGAGGQGGGLSAGGPEDMMLTLNDKDYAKRRVRVGGKVYQHTGEPGDAEKMRIFEGKIDPITRDVNRLDKLGPLATVPGTKDWNEAVGLMKGLSTSIAGLKSTEIGSQRINEAEATKAEEQLRDPTKVMENMNGYIKTKRFFEGLDNTAEAVRKENLLGYKGSYQPKSFKPIGGK